jgi:hypothetical protein
MKLIANRQLHGDYGTVMPGQYFETTEEIGAHLVRERMAREATAPRIQYDTKVITAEVKQAEPFRNLFVSDTESPRVATGGHRELPGADLPAAGITHSGRRLRSA